jgi:hypothetical protein
MNDYDPYPTFIGIEWSFENNAMLNFRKRKMSFETDTLCMIVPLYPNEGYKYNEPIDEDAQISLIENFIRSLDVGNTISIPPLMES